YTFTSGDGGSYTFSSSVILITEGDQTLTVTDADTAISGSAIVTVASPIAPPGGGGGNSPKGGLFPAAIGVLSSQSAMPLLPAYLAPATPVSAHRTQDLDDGSVNWLFAELDLAGRLPCLSKRIQGAVAGTLPDQWIGGHD